MGVVATAFLVIGILLPVLPLYVHIGLNLSTFVVGIVTGSQFIASILSRVSAGHFADRRGPKQAVIVGLIAAAASGGVYLISSGLSELPWLSAGVLIAGRALLGAAESFIITGAAAWGLAAAGSQNAGRVIAWVGMAMFAAMAVGAPVGISIYALGGFGAVAAATVAIPLLTLLLVAPLQAVAGSSAIQAGFRKVATAVWMPGIGSAFSSLGYGAMLAFSSLLASERGWSPIWLTFTAFALALVLTRLLFGHVPDRLGGARVALVCVIIEACGLCFIWLAAGPILAAIGGALAGLGYSLVYPALGVEAVRRAPPESRGLAMGAYTVFLDLALGLGSPVLGLIAGHAGLSAAFLATAVMVACGAIVALRLLFSGAVSQAVA